MSLTAIKLDQETLAKLDEAASFRSVSRETLLREAIDDLADYARYYRENVEAGIKDADEGRLVSDEQMEAEAEALLARIDKS